MESQKDDIDTTTSTENHSYYHYTNYAYVPDIKCTGCATHQPNQLAHMDPGGCLYVPEDDDI